MSNDMRVCIQSLAAYNGGRLVFEWLDFPMGEDELAEAQARVLSRGGGEELMIADSEGFPFKVGEYDSLTKLNEWAEDLDGRRGFDAEAFAAYCENIHVKVEDDPLDVIEDYEEAYVGEFRSRADFAEETMCGVIEIPEHLQYYIDWEKMGRDMVLDGYYETRGYYFRAL